MNEIRHPHRMTDATNPIYRLRSDFTATCQHFEQLLAQTQLIRQGYVSLGNGAYIKHTGK